MSEEPKPARRPDSTADGDDYQWFRHTGLADITCPICRDAGRDVTIGFLHEDRRDRVKRLKAVERTPSGLLDPDEPDDGLPRMAGRFVTDSRDEAVHLTCPHPACGRTTGPHTAQAMFRRLRAGLPLTVR